MKVLSVFTIAVFLSITVFAQQSGKIAQTIKGKVINATTNEPVSYTNIGLEGTYFGTASDGEGNFELKIPEEMVSKNIFFSAVGFKNKQFPVQTLFEKEFNVIKIQSQSYGIDDIDIAAQNMVLIRILRMASENIPYNFIQGPYNLIGNYSNKKTIGNTTSEQNSEILVFDQNGYKNPSKEDAFQSLKYSIKKAKAGDEDYSFSTGTTNLDELLDLDWVRSATSILNPPLTAGFQLKMEDQPTINGKEYWEISFSEKKPTLAGSGDFYATLFEGKITINKEDYSILKIDGRIESPKNSRQGKALALNDTNSTYYKNVTSEFSIEYKDLKPSKIILDKTYTFDGKKVSESSSLEITKVKATNVNRLNSRQYFTGE